MSPSSKPHNSLSRLATFEFSPIRYLLFTMVSLDTLPPSVFSNIFFFLPQNDKLSLIKTSKHFYDQGIKSLYSNISISANPIVRTNKWYIETTWSHVSGFRGIHRDSNKNDYLIYLKLHTLVETIKTNHEIAGLINNVNILDKVFNDEEGVNYLQVFVDSLSQHAKNIKSLQISEELELEVRQNIPSLTSITTSELGTLSSPESIEILTVHLNRFTESHEHPITVPQFRNLKELILIDEESAALRILKNLSEMGIKKLSLKRLVLNHVHGLHDYNAVLRSLTIIYIEACIDLSVLEELEMVIGCEQSNCDCLGEFLDDLAPYLRNLKKLSLHEKTFHRDHYLTENWDVDICRFMMAIPSSNLKMVSIRHNPPINGKLKNGFEGNYFRRRRLFEKVIPNLKNLEVVASPTLLQTAACYEIVVSDLLWNGCECDYCKETLPVFDKYLMDHGYYDDEEADFKDMLAPRLFGLANNEFLKRLKNKYDLDVLNQAPVETYWGFHGYENITCFQDIEHCMLDERFFEPLLVCVSHFFREQVKYLKEQLPKLRTVILSGVYFTISDDKDRVIECVYDNENEK